MSMTPEQLLFVGLLSLACCLVGSTANLLSLSYFLFGNQNKCHISNILFKLINITDLIICLAVLPVAVSAISYGTPHFFDTDILCNLWVFVWYTVSRYSLFLIAVLSVARTNSLLYPLFPQQKAWYLAPCGMYLFLLLAQETFPYWYGEAAHYRPQIVSCGWFLEEILDVNSVQYHVAHMVFVVIETVVPILVITVSSILSWAFLCLINRRRNTVFRANSNETSKASTSVCNISLKQVSINKSSSVDQRPSQCSDGLKAADTVSRSASFTILIIGGVCLVLNIPFGLVIVLSSVEQFTDCYLICLQRMVSHQNFSLLMFLIHTGAIELNSVINPLLYICRMNRLRRFILGLLKFKRVRFS